MYAAYWIAYQMIIYDTTACCNFAMGVERGVFVWDTSK